MFGRESRSPDDAPDKKRDRPSNKRHTELLLLFVASLAVGMIATHLFDDRASVRVIPYSEFRALLADGQVDRAVVASDAIRGTLAAGNGPADFVTYPVDPAVADDLSAAEVVFEGAPPPSPLYTIARALVPIALFLGLWLFLMRRSMAGSGPAALMKAAGSRAKAISQEETTTRFADVAGIDEAKSELEEIVSFLRDPEATARLGARMPKGMLLVGPPGTGKTLLARAVAGEAGVPFFSISGSEFVEMFVGVGAARVRDLFAQAREAAPCIIFVDELDALGRARSSSSSFGGHDEKEQTLNQLLVELDGFDGGTGIVVLAATNRPEVLDPALLRAGRFDRRVTIGRPDRAGRVAILGVHAAGIETEPGLSLDDVAALTPGFSGADLANLVNEAAIVATRRGARAVALEDFDAAIERQVAGLEQRSRRMELRERRIVATHEMGHALVATALPASDPVTKISIIPRDMGALGFTLQRPAGERQLETREDLEVRLAVLMGGRAAERLVFGHLSTGAADDLARATQIAREMVTRFAMVPDLGNVSFVDGGPRHLGPMAATAPYSDDTARRIDGAVRNIVDDAFVRASELLTTRRDLLACAAETLLERETLSGAALEDVLAPARPYARSA